MELTPGLGQFQSKTLDFFGWIGRLFKASPQLKGLEIIFDTFINALPSLLSIGALVFLILYIFAILGMNLFGKVAHHGPCLNQYLFRGEYV